MTTLAESLSATDRILQTVGPLGFETNYPIPILVGSECLIVTRQMAKAGYQYQVLRAQNGTAPSAHAAGVSVTAYSGGGSGGVTVDNGSDPPAAVTTLVAPGAVIDSGSADLSDVLQFRLAGPFHITFATANLVNPADLGAVVEAIPAGSVVDVVLVPTAEWVGSAPGDELLLNIGTGVATSVQVADYDLGNFSPVNTSIVLREGDFWIGDINGTASALRNALARRLIVVADANLYAAALTSGTLSAGSCDIYLLIATPAS